MERPLPYTSFPVHYSSITLPFDTIASEILRVLLNKIQNNRMQKPHDVGLNPLCCSLISIIKLGKITSFYLHTAAMDVAMQS
jgi:hypothetical protein